MAVTRGAPITMIEPRGIFVIAGMARELRQAEIITDLVQFVPSGQVDEQGRFGGQNITHRFSVVLSQDCDLLQDFNRRESGGDGSLLSVLLYVAQPAIEVRADLKGDLWKRVTQNANERFHLLENVPAESDLSAVGIDCLIIDFKSFFTLAPTEILRQCDSGKARRRCRLNMPYREHLQCRAAFYLQRVGVPEPHKYVEAKRFA